MTEEVEQRIVIVKTSSLGDIVQAFDVLHYLHQKFPKASIDWIVESRFASIAAAHPLIDRVIAFDIKSIKRKWWKKEFWQSLGLAIRSMRRMHYHWLFDLQGNCKSAAVTFLCRADTKIGFGRKSVREWPNLLVTQRRFNVSRSINIRQQYVCLVQKFFGDRLPVEPASVRFTIDENAKIRLQTLLSCEMLQKKKRVMVCPGSKWVNKQIPLETLTLFLARIQEALQCAFLLIWGSEEEQKNCLVLHQTFFHSSIVVDRLEIPLWQNVMGEMDLVIAVDSSALHLCATTSTPSFSIFGPTSPDVFKPLGINHFAVRGQCPYQKVFEKQCPQLRNCPTGACIRDIPADQLFDQFLSWWKSVYSAATGR